MEFKGTTGKWEITEEKGKILIETCGRNNWAICETITNESEDKANANLISKSQDLLQACTETFYLLDKIQTPTEFEISQLRNKLYLLIKNTTE